MDTRIKAITKNSRIRITVVDVTMTAKALEARHLSGPVAGAILAESLGAVALMGADAASAEEAWMLRLNASGSIGGVLVEATGSGKLRGFTNRKTLDELDGKLPVDTAAALGDSGSVQVVSTLPGRILSQAVLQVTPPQPRFILGKYFNHSLQIPTGCNVWAVADNGGLHSTRALLVQRMEDSDQECFIRMLENLEKGHLDAYMEQRSWPADIMAPLQDALGCDEILVREKHALSFGCRCNKEKVLGVLASLSKEELKDMIDAGAEQRVTCHMCGEGYTADSQDLQSVLDKLP